MWSSSFVVLFSQGNIRIILKITSEKIAKVMMSGLFMVTVMYSTFQLIISTIKNKLKRVMYSIKLLFVYLLQFSNKIKKNLNRKKKDFQCGVKFKESCFGHRIKKIIKRVILNLSHNSDFLSCNCAYITQIKLYP